VAAGRDSIEPLDQIPTAFGSKVGQQSKKMGKSCVISLTIFAVDTNDSQAD